MFKRLENIMLKIIAFSFEEGEPWTFSFDPYDQEEFYANKEMKIRITDDNFWENMLPALRIKQGDYLKVDLLLWGEYMSVSRFDTSIETLTVESKPIEISTKYIHLCQASKAHKVITKLSIPNSKEELGTIIYQKEKQNEF